MARRGLASANASTRARVSSSGGRALWASGRAHTLTHAERSKGGRHLTPEKARDLAIRSHAARRANRHAALERIEQLEARYRPSEEEEEDPDEEEDDGPDA